MIKKFVSLILSLVLSILLGAVCIANAQESDDIIDSMVRIKARPDFSFRYDLTNKGTGEASPLENDYYLSAFKVTNEQYAEFVAETSHKIPNYWANGTYPQGKGNHPVLNISYSDAVSYCVWLSSKYDNWNFRLPTEAEWENAAMGEYYGDSSVKYPNGKQTPSYNLVTGELTTTFNFNGVIAAKLFNDYGSDYVVNYIKGDFSGMSETLGECISISKTGGVSNWANHGGAATKGYFLQTDLYKSVSANGGYTTPVDFYEPNSLGLYDMAGNAWDLTSSIITAQNGLEKGVDCYAVRGGSWYATSRSCTFSYRGEGRKDSPSSTVGFRLAADYTGENSSSLLENMTNQENEVSSNQMILTIDEKDALVFGQRKTNDVAPIIRNNRTMLPARFVAKNLGATVIWSENEPEKVWITKNNVEIIIYIGNNKAYVNGEEMALDSPAFIENDRTYCPVRFICEKLGASVEWNNDTREVVITK